MLQYSLEIAIFWTRQLYLEKKIGRGTWIDKLGSEMLEREVKLGRDTSILRVESGLGASGIPHVGILGML